MEIISQFAIIRVSHLKPVLRYYIVLFEIHDYCCVAGTLNFLILCRGRDIGGGAGGT